MKTVLSLAAGLALIATSFAATPEVGSPAPDFTLKNTSGQDVSLSSYKGQYIVLEWVNFGCPFVRKHYDSKNMQKLQKEETDKGVIWLSVCSSAPGKQGNMSPKDAAAACDKEGSEATAYLLDEDGKVGELYNAKTTPEMYVINPEGVLIYQGAIDDQSSPDPASIKSAKNYVAAALSEAKAGKPVTTPTTKSYGCSVKY